MSKTNLNIAVLLNNLNIIIMKDCYLIEEYKHQVTAYYFRRGDVPDWTTPQYVCSFHDRILKSRQKRFVIELLFDIGFDTVIEDNPTIHRKPAIR